MKISFKRLLALVLCAAMLFGMLPMQQVKADDLHQFTTMDDLRELANATYEELTYAAFMGTEFVFESIELPDNLVLSMPEANVTIPAGVNVNLGTIQCVNLTVEGTLDARQAEPRESVTVSGSMNVRVYFLLDLDTQVTGMENITLGNPLLFQREGSVSTLEELQAALALAESATDGAQYSIWLSGDGIATEEDITIPSNLRLNVNAPLTVCSLNLDGVLNIQNTGTVNIQGDLLLGEYCNITGAERLTAENGMVQRVFSVSSSVELLQAAKRAATPVLEGAWEIIEITDSFELVHDVTIPAGCTLRVPVDMSIGAGCTLTVDGMMEITANVTNFGTIKNNGELTVYGNMGSVLTFAETGSYTGSGEMMVINSTYEDIIPGMDLSKVNIEQGQGIGGIRWIITAKPAPTPGPDGMYHFTSFAELEQLAAMDLRTWTDAVYDGADAFVFDTISLPENLALDFIGSSVVIPEGVTVDAHYLFASWLTVNGNLNSYVVTADEALTVTGTLAVSNGLSLRNYTELTGGDNIVLLNDQVRFVRNCNIASLEELEACIADAASCTDHRIVYELYVENEMELTKDYAIPANANFRLRAPVTIAQGATLTLNGNNNDLYATLIVNGTVVNNGFIDYEYDGGGLMDFTQGGTYAGTGTLWIPAGTLTDETFLDAFPGWMPIGYRVINEGNGWTVQYIKHFNTSFTNFEEMKELAKETYDEWTQIYYEGEGPLVIDGDITFNGNVVIEANGKEVRIAEGVTASIWQIRCDTLIVEGTANSRFFDVITKLEVSGSAAVEGSISVEEETVIIGRENVSGHIDRYCRIMDEDHLHRALELAAASTDSNETFGIDFVNSNGVILTRSVTLPENTYWMVDAPLVISEGVEFVVNSYAGQIMGPVEVRGHLVNSAETQMYGDWGGSISFVNGGTYASDDALWLYYVEGDPMAYVPGIDMTGYELWKWDDQTWMIAPVGYNPGGGSGDGNMQTFGSFEELKELASQAWEWTWIQYTGGEPLEITEDIVLPRNLQVQTSGGVRIAEGVNARFNNLTCGWLEVNGDLHVDYADITQDGLWVNGSLSVEDRLNISYKASISNIDRVHMLNEWGTIHLVYTNAGMNLTRLREFIAQLDPYEPHRIRHDVHLDMEEMVVEEDLVVPSKLNVYFEQPLTVAAGATLTLNSDNVYLWTLATVNGTLVNNSWLMVSAYSGGTMTFAEGSTYTGTGTIAVEKEPSVSLEDVVPGLELSNLYVRQDGDYWWYISTTNGGIGGMQTFGSFEELKELASQSWDGWTWIEYNGGDVLEITEDIALPENLQVQTSGGVRIAEGVNARFNNLSCGWLEVNGDLYVGHTDAFEYLTVTGSLTVEENIYISSRANLEGRDKIAFANGWAGIYREFFDVDLDEFKERIVEAEENAHADSRMHYVLYLSEEAIVLEESLTVPSMVNVYFEGPLTVAAGATLTLNSENVQLYAPATVYGNLNNDSWFFVSAYNGATLTFAEGSTYTGSGTIAVEKDPSVSLESVLPGLDLSNLYVRQDGDWWWYISTTQQGGGGGGLTFSSFEELQALAAESYDWGYMMYVGNEDFVISEDISMPANTYVDFGEHNVVVSEGVTANFMQMICKDLTVYGTLNAEYQSAMGNVAVYGAFKTNQLQIGETTTITGLENIKFTSSYNPLSRIYYVNSGEELAAALNKAANPLLPNETACIQFNGGPIILNEDATLPKNCELYISNDMVVAEGATLTINGMVSIGNPLTVKGTLVNNYDIYTWDGRMIIAQGGKYEGRGTLRVLGGNDYNTVFQGLNLEDFQITNNYDEWRLVYVAGLPPVAAPSELEWGYTYKDGVKVALPGAVSWKSGITDTSGIEYVYFYRINEDGSETLINEYGGVGYDAKNYMAGYNSSVDLLLSDIPSGRYYFTVYSQGDYENTKDSETVKSAVWEYTKPSDRLDTATNLGWSDDSFRAEWTNPNGEDEVHYALVSWYYKDREDGYEYIFARFISQDGDYHELPEYHMSIMGTGYYSYEVQFISADITKTLSSELSERSGWYHLAEMPETPTVQLGTLVNDGSKTNEEKIEAVQNIGAEELKEAMQTNGDASALIEMLEQTAAGGTAKVEVADETVELAVDEIVIVGANLNSKENKEESVKLVIDKVEEVREVTGNYEASTAVQFSMTLENVKDTKNLDVPVVIILPVPEDIDPEKMVILHYHDDGSYDTIIPETYMSGGKAYAQFILTSFSDFVILEKLAALLGDVDLNEGVDVDDVLALLWAVLFPDMYPVEVETDFDHNGSVDVDDVLTLLWHVLFPDMYPL